MNDKEEIPQLVQKAIEQPDTDISAWFGVVVNHQEAASQNILIELL